MVLCPPPPRLEPARIYYAPRDRSASKSAISSAAARGGAINEALMFSVKNEIFILPPASEKFYRPSEARFGFFRCLIRDKNFVQENILA